MTGARPAVRSTRVQQESRTVRCRCLASCSGSRELSRARSADVHLHVSVMNKRASIATHRCLMEALDWQAGHEARTCALLNVTATV